MNLAGLRDHWRNDLIAGFSVALVALPLALGIATAAGAPPISGLISAIVAGLFATFLRGSNVAINGPGNSLIVIVAAAFAAFGGGPEVFPHVLGAVVVAGCAQVLLGLLRLGKMGDLVPPAVIQGLLAAIGLIIVGKQAHVMFGRSAGGGGPVDVFLALPETVAHLHPAAAVIGVMSLLILVAHPKLKAKVIHFVPAPLWVVIFAIPTAWTFEHFAPEVSDALGWRFELSPEMLVSIPDDLTASIVIPAPDFSRIGEPAFWMVVLTLTLVTSIENIVSVKAVDKLDTYRRRSNLDRDLLGMGVATVLSGLLGGLPVLTVIARSSVNVNHGAKTGWSNFFAASVLLVFVLFLGSLIQEIALAALAGILVYTGYKLAAPQVVEDTLRKGPDHFLVFGITLIATLAWGLLWGLFTGLAAELLSHLLILGMAPREALRRLRETAFAIVERADEPRVLRVIGIANFLRIPGLRTALDELTNGEKSIVDFSHAMLVDNATLDYCHDVGRRYERTHGAGKFEVIGLEAHRALSDHPDALHALERRHQEKRLTPRQRKVAEAAEQRGWSLEARRDWSVDQLDEFHFFRIHPIEYRDTVVEGGYSIGDQLVPITLADVTFDEGALIGEVYHTTTLRIRLPFEIPELILEREELLDRALELAGFQDIDFKHFTAFSRRFVLKGPDEDAIREFMRPALLAFFEREDLYHLESTGQEIVVFKTFLRRATPAEIEEMLTFGERLVRVLMREPAADSSRGEASGEAELERTPEADAGE